MLPNNMTPNSKIYVGTVSHTRIAPTKHQFQYPVYFYAFDLAELPELDEQCRFFGYNRFQPISIRAEDYFGPTRDPLFDKAKAFIQQHNPPAYDITRIELVTSARYFNYVFNPVSFFYCYRADQSLACILAYVNNTFGESHIYALNNPLQSKNGNFTRYQMDKDFYVSPFFDLEGHYDFHFAPLTDKLDIHISLIKQNKPVFTAQLTGDAQPLSSSNLLKTIGRYPITASTTMPRILWEAGKLYFQRRLPMYKKPIATSDYTIQVAPPTAFQKWCMNQSKRLADTIKFGHVKLILPDQSEMIVGNPDLAPQHRIWVRDYNFFSRVVTGFDIGLGESFMEGEWDTDDLTGLLAFFIRNFDHLGSGPAFVTALPMAYHRWMHNRRKNSEMGSKKNIQAHYDLSNQMYQQFLDETMTYSAAVFDTPEQDLAEAQRNKLRKIIEKARIEPHHHILEIGSGWGSFSIEAAQQTGCRVTTVTISAAQYKLAKERIEAAGLSDQIEIKLCDYRKLEGQFDRLVSIEMIEAVGHNFFPEYFKTCERLLKPNGIMVIQAITFPDKTYHSYRKSFDWIRKHIFPGGHLPSLNAMSDALTQHTQLQIENVENIGPHYAVTLARWRQRFLEAEANVRTLGFDEEFCRKWVYYFSSCEAAFATHFLGNLQLVITRTLNSDFDLWPNEG